MVEDIGDYASIIRPEIVRRFVIEDAIPVGSDPGWVPPPLDKYFEFSHPYVWLDSLIATGENTIYSNTDWVLSVGDELFKFGSGYVWLDEMNNKGEQEIELFSDIGLREPSVGVAPVPFSLSPRGGDKQPRWLGEIGILEDRTSYF